MINEYIDWNNAKARQQNFLHQAEHDRLACQACVADRPQRLSWLTKGIGQSLFWAALKRMWPLKQTMTVVHYE